MREKSAAIFEALKKRIPGGVCSPVRAFPGLGMVPMVAVRGEGSRVWDADGLEYVDYCGSWGALILGHAHPKVVEAAREQMGRGSSFGMTTPYEERLARKIWEHMPSMERMRFVSSGTEATMSALRVARGATGRRRVVKFVGHYHGHVDGLLVKAGSGVAQLPEAGSLGVPSDFIKYTVCLPFNEVDVVREYLRGSEDVAAVIVEPVGANKGLVPGTREFMTMLREETEKKGIVLIFDEVITGFRVGLGGAQEKYGVRPDLTCLGKVMGGGFPAAAFGGRKELMECLAPLGGVYQAGTLSGNPVAMCAGLATLEVLEQDGFYERLEEKTKVIVEALGGVHIASMFATTLGQEEYGPFFKALFAKGVYFAPFADEVNFLSLAHTEEDVEKTVEALRECRQEALPLEV